MSTSAKTVKVIAQIGNVSIPVTAISLRHTINSLPMVEFTTQLSNHGTRNSDGTTNKTGINLSEFQKLNKLVQQKFYNNFSLAPDTVIQVTDGDGNVITFNGFLMQPMMRIISGQVSLVFSAIHVGAAFQAFNGSVYNTQFQYDANSLGDYFNGISTQEVGAPGLLSQLENLPPIQASEDEWSTGDGVTAWAGTLFSEDKPPRTDSIAQRIYTIINGLNTDALKNTANQNEEVQRILNTFILNANTAVLPYIKHFLMGSLPTTIIKGLTDFEADEGFPSDSPLHQTIYSILTDSSNFLESALRCISPFLFQLNAGWAGQLAFEPNQFITSPGNRLIKAPIEDISFSLAGVHEIPLAQVIVLYPAESFYDYGGNMGVDQVPLDLMGAALQGSEGLDIVPQNLDASRLYGVTTAWTNIEFLGDTLRYLARYPETPTVTAGRYLTVMAPAWVYPTSYTAANMLDDTTSNESRFKAAVENTQNAANNLNAMRTSRMPILQYIAESTYKSTVLERTNAFVTIPLCLSVQAGRTYNLQSMDGAPLYQGYLRRVTHSIVIGEQRSTATTSLDFSHIIVNGANLDNINIPAPTGPILDDVPITTGNLA